MIAVIDYQMGNLHSIAKALEFVGAEVVIVRDPRELQNADRIVLPGVGAFPDGIQHLRTTGFLPFLEHEINEKRKPFLGICLGMQLLAQSSEEFGVHDGLGVFPVTVQKFSFPPESGLKVPHIGWNTVRQTAEHPIFQGIPKETDFYFVHSFFIAEQLPTPTIATCEYGVQFSAIIAHDSVVATQFHPEKSQKYGLKFLHNFVNWQPV